MDGYPKRQTKRGELCGVGAKVPHGSPDNGGLHVDQPVILVLGVPPITVDGMIGNGLASVSSDLICCALLPAAIP